MLSLLLLTGCSPGKNDLGFDQIVALPNFAQTGSGPETPPVPVDPCPAPCEEDPVDAGVVDTCLDPRCAPGNCQPACEPEPVDAGAVDVTPDANTGTDTDAAPAEQPVRAPHPLRNPPPNYFVELLGVTEEETATRLEDAFQHYFHGDSNTEALYYEIDDQHGYIFDVLHEDTRADALGYGLMVAIQLDKQVEFDNIWRYAYDYLRVQSGPAQGYFYESCATDGTDCSETLAAFGVFNITTALLLAEARWGNGTVLLDYGGQARALLSLLRGAVPAGVAASERPLLFADKQHLARGEVGTAEATTSQAALALPSFYEYWGAKSADPYWLQVADASREYLKLAAHPATGLVPHVSYFDGTPVDDDDLFDENSYSYLLGLALDRTWYGVAEGEVELADRLVQFFAGFNGEDLPLTYSIAGMPVGQSASAALASMAGSVAAVSTLPERVQLVRRVWETPLHSGLYRYFDGTLHLLGLLYLSGQYRGY